MLGELGLRVEFGVAPAMAADGEGEELEGEPATEQGRGVERDREAVVTLLDEVIGEEGYEREEEEQAQVGQRMSGSTSFRRSTR